MGYDAIVIGAGPAGTTASRLLAEWGHRVALVHRPKARPVNVAESLPPSVRTAFHLAGIQEQVDGAGFARSAGNAAWWGTAEPRVETYPPPRWGYHVRRADFDRLLCDLAVARGVCLLESAPPASAPFVLDCSGRTGVLARRGFRRTSGYPRTMAIGAVWRKPGGLPYAGLTLVEAFSGGWAWSVPVDEDRRYVSVMIDARRAADYRAQLATTEAFRKMLDGALIEGNIRACDATPYTCSRFAGSGILVVGDAASFLDPLSSFGVKKAITSAWMAAVAVHTALKDGSRAPLAIAYFEERERQAYEDARRHTARYCGQVAETLPHPFWSRRASSEPGFYAPAGLTAQLELLRTAAEIRLRRSEQIGVEKRPAVEGNEVVERPKLVAPQLPPGLEFVNGVEISRLLELSERHTQLPDLWRAYNSGNEEVDLPNFLGALCLLLAKDVLTLR